MVGSCILTPFVNAVQKPRKNKILTHKKECDTKQSVAPHRR